MAHLLQQGQQVPPAVPPPIQAAAQPAAVAAQPAVVGAAAAVATAAAAVAAGQQGGQQGAPPGGQQGGQPGGQPGAPPGGGGPPGAGGIPPPVPPAIIPPVIMPPVFVRFPGEYEDPNAPQFIDYSLERERKTYKTAIAGLDEKFDLSPSKLQSFLNRVQERVMEHNWTGIINIILPAPFVGGMAPPPVNLITNYGQVTLEQVRAHAEVYMAVQHRSNQQSGMLYKFLTNSLDANAHNIMDINPDTYTINGQKEGVLFLKEIITKAYVDTNATVDTIRKAIAKLDEKIKEFKFDIKAFNAYVQTQVNLLAAHGIQCTELLTNLFSAYNQVQDAEFAQHVRLYYFQYTSASIRGQNVDITREMMLAMEQNYHRRLIEGTWNPKQIKTDKDRIIALESTIAELKAGNAQEKAPSTNKWAWKKIPPKPGSPNTIKKNKKDYHWCPKHNQWTIHKPEECHYVPKGNSNNPVANQTTTTTDNDDHPGGDSPPKPALQIDPVLQSIVGGAGRVFA
jgi:hypothetical protein